MNLLFIHQLPYVEWSTWLEPLMGKFKTQGEIHKYLTWPPVMGKIKTQGNVHGQGVKSIERYGLLVGNPLDSMLIVIYNTYKVAANTE